MDIYACGPSPMIDATRQWLRLHGLGNANLYYEKFVASGLRAGQRSAQRVAEPLDLSRLRREGRGTAVVIGGSIAGMATAKCSPAPSRACSCWRRIRTTGALKVDRAPRKAGICITCSLPVSASSNRSSPASSTTWLQPARSGSTWASSIESCSRAPGRRSAPPASRSCAPAGRCSNGACAGGSIPSRRSTIAMRARSSTWCSTRTTRSVVGVIVERDGERTALPAEFVVDASGKNTPVPALARACRPRHARRGGRLSQLLLFDHAAPRAARSAPGATK